MLVVKNAIPLVLIYCRGGTVMPTPRRVKYWDGFDSMADNGVLTVETTGCLVGGSISCTGVGCESGAGSYAGAGAAAIGVAGGSDETM